MSRIALRVMIALVLLSGPILVGILFLTKSPSAPNLAPGIVLFVLISAFGPVITAYRAARGTSLRGAIVWATLALVIAIVSQVIALGEPAQSGRPWTGQWVYLATLASFAAAISVLNARTPGSGAWAILMGILVVVFLLPWLEGAGLARTDRGWDRLRLTAPWTIFYVLLLIAGVTNFLPTSYFWGALILGTGLAGMFLGLVRTDLPRYARGILWEIVAWSFGMAIWAAWLRRSTAGNSSGLERLWLWFRDHWGVVWALRVMERFNRTADACDWPIRLAWQGVVLSDGITPATLPEIPEAALETLLSLLRRFASAERLTEIATGPCPDHATV